MRLVAFHTFHCKAARNRSQKLSQLWSNLNHAPWRKPHEADKLDSIEDFWYETAVTLSHALSWNWYLEVLSQCPDSGMGQKDV